ncbi:hypothetical protein ACIG56_02880 [Nocardia fusca]
MTEPEVDLGEAGVQVVDNEVDTLAVGFAHRDRIRGGEPFAADVAVE